MAMACLARWATWCSASQQAGKLIARTQAQAPSFIPSGVCARRYGTGSDHFFAARQRTRAGLAFRDETPSLPGADSASISAAACHTAGELQAWLSNTVHGGVYSRGEACIAAASRVRDILVLERAADQVPARHVVRAGLRWQASESAQAQGNTSTFLLASALRLNMSQDDLVRSFMSSFRFSGSASQTAVWDVLGAAGTAWCRSTVTHKHSQARALAAFGERALQAVRDASPVPEAAPVWLAPGTAHSLHTLHMLQAACGAYSFLPGWSHQRPLQGAVQCRLLGASCGLLGELAQPDCMLRFRRRHRHRLVTLLGMRCAGAASEGVGISDSFHSCLWVALRLAAREAAAESTSIQQSASLAAACVAAAAVSPQAGMQAVLGHVFETLRQACEAHLAAPPCDRLAVGRPHAREVPTRAYPLHELTDADGGQALADAVQLATIAVVHAPHFVTGVAHHLPAQASVQALMQQVQKACLLDHGACPTPLDTQSLCSAVWPLLWRVLTGAHGTAWTDSSAAESRSSSNAAKGKL